MMSTYLYLIYLLPYVAIWAIGSDRHRHLLAQVDLASNKRRKGKEMGIREL